MSFISRIYSWFSKQPVSLGDSLTEITEKNKDREIYFGPHSLHGTFYRPNNTHRFQGDFLHQEDIAKAHSLFLRHEKLFERIPTYGKTQAEHGINSASLGTITVGPLQEETIPEKKMNCHSLHHFLQHPAFMKIFKEKGMEGVWLSSAPYDLDPEHYDGNQCEVAVHWGKKENHS